MFFLESKKISISVNQIFNPIYNIMTRKVKDNEKSNQSTYEVHSMAIFVNDTNSRTNHTNSEI